MRELSEFRAGAGEELSYPNSLSNTERKLIHHLCGKMGLHSKSYGKGEARHLQVKRKKVAAGPAAKVPRLSLHVDSEAAIEAYFGEFGPTTRDDVPRSARYGATGRRSGRGGGGAASGRRMGRAPVRQTPEQFAAAAKARQGASEWPSVLAGRRRLPAYAKATRLCELVRHNQVVVVSGETGCGKSTQVPQFLLDDAEMGPGANVIVTQPRRISAVSLAERVAYERCEEVGETVGFNIRLESVRGPKTQLVFCTTGVLMRMLTNDPMLAATTHLVIDEVHERDLYSDFLLITLRDVLPRRPDLRVIIMSATLQLDLFVSYFGGCPNLHIEGYTHPVRELYLEDVLELTDYLAHVNVDEVAGESEARVHAAPVVKGGGDTPAVLAASVAAMTPVATPAEDGAAEAKGDDATEEARARAAAEARAEEEAAAAAAAASKAVPEFVCGLCKRSDFASAEELGVHAAMCFGADGGADDGIPDDLFADDTVEDLGALGLDELGLGLGAAGAGAGATAGGEELAPGAGMTAEEESAAAEAAAAFAAAAGSYAGSRGGEVEDPDADPERAKARKKLVQAYGHLYDTASVDHELIVQLIEKVCGTSEAALGLPGGGATAQHRGAILVFLPGWDDIQRVRDQMAVHPVFGDERSYWVLPLHSSIPSREQRKVFRRPPGTARKIVLSTNLAETSITIDDIVFVIDAGKVKQIEYDPYTQCSSLQAVWTSKASAKQRAGRAGRVRPGLCFHLFSKQRHSAMAEFQVPEILRTPLEELCLQIKQLERSGCLQLSEEEVTESGGSAVEAFLDKALQSPEKRSIRGAIQLLRDIGALQDDDTETLTPLGEHLAVLPMAPRLGKMVLMSVLFRCLDPVLTIACAMAYRSPFVLPMRADLKAEAERARVRFAAGAWSDHLAILGAFQGYLAAKGGRGGEWGYCRENHLSPTILSTVSALKAQLVDEMARAGHITRAEYPELNRNARNTALVMGVLAAGMFPNIVRRLPEQRNLISRDNKKYVFQTSSVNALMSKPRGVGGDVRAPAASASREVEWYVYDNLMQTGSKVTITQSTRVPPLAVLLMCGHGHEVDATLLDAVRSGVTGLAAFGEEDDDDDDGDDGDDGDDDDEGAGDEDGLGAAAGRPVRSHLEVYEGVSFEAPPRIGRMMSLLRVRTEAAFQRQVVQGLRAAAHRRREYNHGGGAAGGGARSGGGGGGGHGGGDAAVQAADERLVETIAKALSIETLGYDHLSRGAGAGAGNRGGGGAASSGRIGAVSGQYDRVEAAGGRGRGGGRGGGGGRGRGGRGSGGRGRGRGGGGGGSGGGGGGRGRGRGGGGGGRGGGGRR